MAVHVRAMLDFTAWAFPRSITATTSARWRKDEGVNNAFDFPGFVPAYIRPLFCRGVGPFRWAALSGDPEDIYKTDAKVKELLPDDTHLHNWLDMARERITFPGPAGAHLLGRPRRPPSARPRVQRDGRLGRTEGTGRHRPRSSRFRLGRLAQPRDRGDAGRHRMRCPTGRCSTRCSTPRRGATWVSLHHGGGVGMGFSQHCRHGHRRDGTKEAAERIERVLWNDPATGVMRHADAGYDIGDRVRAREGAGPAQASLTDNEIRAPCRYCAPRLSPHAVEEWRRRDPRDRGFSAGRLARRWTGASAWHWSSAMARSRCFRVLTAR